MLKNLKLGHKLISLFLVMALIVAVTGAFSIWGLNRVGKTVQLTLKTRATQEKLVVLLKTALQECRVHLLESATVIADMDDFDGSKTDYELKRDRFASNCDLLLKGNAKLGIPPAGKGSNLEQRILTVQERWHEFTRVADKLLARKESLLKGAAGHANIQALADQELNKLARVEIPQKSDELSQSVDDLLVTVVELTNQANKEAIEIQKKAKITLLFVILGGVGLAFAFGTLSTRNIVSRLNMMVKALAKGADGDLSVSVQVDSGDELGSLGNDFNLMVQKLASMVNKVKLSIAELGQVTVNINDISRQGLATAERQATGVMQTSSAIVQINASINGVAQAMDSLSLSASESSSSTMELVASIEEVAANVETLSRSVDEVSSSITEMAASIREIDGSVASLMEASLTTAKSVASLDTSIGQIEQNATANARISSQVLHDAELGKSSVEATIAGIGKIKQSSVITSEVIVTLSEKAQDIGAILSVIDEVAEQTNLLALNAAIIAAQAGEHGKGFAVVAEEIKDLAERTSSSTREISQVIAGVQQETRRAVDSISQAEISIAEGESLSIQSGEALAKIVSGIQVASAQMDDIAKTTEGQSKESQMIRRAMDRVSEMVGQIAKATSEQGRGADLIMAAVERMKELNGQVRNSTREQSTVGNFIGKSTENITTMIKKIKQACDEQSKSGEQILHAVNDIQRSTEVNLEANRVAEDAVKRLTMQSSLLQREMNRFVIEQAEGDQPAPPARS